MNSSKITHLGRFAGSFVILSSVQDAVFT